MIIVSFEFWFLFTSLSLEHQIQAIGGRQGGLFPPDGHARLEQVDENLVILSVLNGSPSEKIREGRFLLGDECLATPPLSTNTGSETVKGSLSRRRFDRDVFIQHSFRSYNLRLK